MPHRLTVLLLLISPLLAAQTMPPTCQCVWRGAFLDVAPGSDLVVAGEITQRQGNALDLRVDQIVQGQHYDDRLRLWGSNGKPGICRPEADRFPVGSRWLLALTRIDEVPAGGFNPFTPNISFGRVGDYWLSACGVYWLPLFENRVGGNLLQADRWQWENPQEEINPVLLPLIEAYLQGVLPRQAIVQAAKPNPELQQLMQRSLFYLQQQSDDAP